MSTFKEIFPKKNTFLAAVHSEDVVFDLENIDMAFDAGVDGIFLVNHRTGPKELMGNYEIIREKYPDKWIGVNLLAVRLQDIFDYVTPSVNGIWTDNSYVRNQASDIYEVVQDIAADFLSKRIQLQWPGLYFGGTCFKGQLNYNDDPAVAAFRAMDYMDVVTTSGPNTGKGADPEKIHAMRVALGDFPLAIASGSNPTNVEAFSNTVNVFIIGSWLYNGHLTSSFKGRFEEKHLRQMVRVFEKLNG